MTQGVVSISNTCDQQMPKLGCSAFIHLHYVYMVHIVKQPIYDESPCYTNGNTITHEPARRLAKLAKYDDMIVIRYGLVIKGQKSHASERLGIYTTDNKGGRCRNFMIMRANHTNL